MPPKKKQVRNGFFYFVLEFKDDEEHNGREMPHAFQDLVPLASPKWKALSPEEKKYYNDLAKRESKSGDLRKLDCTGRNVEEVEFEDHECEQLEGNMIRFIKQRFRHLGHQDEVVKEKFYVISFNIFCKTAEEAYLPAEVGLVEYSVAEGITNVYHAFIDPGKIPVGYSFACKETSEATHQIPYVSFKPAEKCETVFNDILNFVDPHGTIDQFPPLYCITEELRQAKGALNFLQRNLKKRVDFYIMDFACLFFELFRIVSEKFVSIGIVRDFLCSSVFTYNRESCCEYHWELDKSEHCALCMAKRICFIMSDHILDDYGITPIPNRHLPKKQQDVVDSYSYSNFSKSDKWSSSAVSSRLNSQGGNSQPSFSRTSSVARGSSSTFGDFEDDTSYPRASASRSHQAPDGTTEKPYKPVRQPRTQNFASMLYDSSAQYAHARVDFPGLGESSAMNREGYPSSNSSSTFSQGAWTKVPVRCEHNYSPVGCDRTVKLEYPSTRQSSGSISVLPQAHEGRRQTTDRRTNRYVRMSPVHSSRSSKEVPVRPHCRDSHEGSTSTLVVDYDHKSSDSISRVIPEYDRRGQSYDQTASWDGHVPSMCSNSDRSITEESLWQRADKRRRLDSVAEESSIMNSLGPCQTSVERSAAEIFCESIAHRMKILPHKRQSEVMMKILQLMHEAEFEL